MCAVPADAKPPFGALEQLPGRDGCTGVYFDSCRPGTLGGQRVVLSPGESFVYAASSDGTVAGYRRNRETGALRALSGGGGCIVGAVTFDEVAAASACTEWDLFGPIPDVAIAMTPDGRHIYLGTGGVRFVPPRESERPAALATVERDAATGELRPAGCISPSVAACSSARGLGRRIGDVTVSPDGTNVYVVSQVEVGEDPGSSIAVFTRKPVSGALSQLPSTAGCIAPKAYSGCATARGLTDSTSSVVVTPDGRNVYVATESYTGPYTGGTILAFARDPATGALVQLPGADGCLASDGREGCATAQPLGTYATQLPELAVSADGRNVYAPFGSGDNVAGGVTILRRDPSTGALTQLPAEFGCISQPPIATCQGGRGLADPTAISLSPDGRNAYESAFNSSVIAVFARRADGALQQLSGRFGCIGSSLLFHEGCAPSPFVQQDIALSRDGSYGYVARDDGLLVFARNGPRIRLKVPVRHCARAGLRIRVRVWTWGGLRRAVVRLDRRMIANRARRRFDVVIPAGGLSPRAHRLSVLATDRRGRRALSARRVAGCRRG